MLRHACGYSLANPGADTRLIPDYLRHKNVKHTVRYTGPPLADSWTIKLRQVPRLVKTQAESRANRSETVEQRLSSKRRRFEHDDHC
jgi:integrase-like protein